MPTFSAHSLQAIQRLRNYRPPPTIYYTLPTHIRAAVLVLLFPCSAGRIRVVLTERSAHMRTFPGQVAFPGGKAEPDEMDAFATARREAEEEIGLPRTERGSRSAWWVENITQMPCMLSRNRKVVRPCVALLHCEGLKNVEEELVPVLEDGGEVQSVFSVDLESFLTGWKGYKGRRFDNGWVMHEFPVKKKNGDGEHNVWGLTARILIDCARIAYGVDPSLPEWVKEIGMENVLRYEVERRGLGTPKEGKPEEKL